MLARTVDAALRFSHQSRNGRCVYNGPAANVAVCYAHIAELSGHGEERAMDVDAEDFFVVGGIVVSKGAEVAGDAGEVDGACCLVSLQRLPYRMHPRCPYSTWN